MFIGYKLSKHKAIELNIERENALYKPYKRVFGLIISLTRSGFVCEIDFFSGWFCFEIYDIREWNEEKGCWQEPLSREYLIRR